MVLPAQPKRFSFGFGQKRAALDSSRIQGDFRFRNKFAGSVLDSFPVLLEAVRHTLVGFKLGSLGQLDGASWVSRALAFFPESK